MKYIVLHIIISTFLLAFPFANISGQIKIDFGLKAGASISKLPKHYSRTEQSLYHQNIVYQYKRWENPLLSPIIGVQIISAIPKHFQLLAGLEYQVTGTRYSGTNTVSNSAGQNEFHENMNLRKICVPVGAGYNFKIKNLESSAMICLRPNFLISGNYYHKWEEGIGIGYVSITEYDPFNPDKSYISPLEKFVNQVSFSFSSKLSQHFKADLSLNFGKTLESYYNAGTISQTLCAKYRTNDFSISIIYLFRNTSEKS